MVFFFFFLIPRSMLPGTAGFVHCFLDTDSEKPILVVVLLPNTVRVMCILVLMPADASIESAGGSNRT